PPVPRGTPGPGANLGQGFGDFGKLNTPPATSPFGRGLGQVVSGWTRDGIRGQDLADRIHWLQQTRRLDRNNLPSFRDRDDLWWRDRDGRWFRDRDIREDQREVRDDLSRLRDDERRVTRDREELRRDLDDLRRDRGGDSRFRDRDIREDQREVRDDLSRLRDDERRVTRDREELRRDFDDLRRDRDRDDHRHDFARNDRDVRGWRDRDGDAWRDRDDHGWRDRGDHRHDHDLVRHSPGARMGDPGKHIGPPGVLKDDHSFVKNHGKLPPADAHHHMPANLPVGKGKGKGK
ncbi:MAG TPA: hypothetical protein VKE40_08145, partial [Gemmataceae bacterium]|nr:hypothetical protein [Gemmataceae bacterium]